MCLLEMVATFFTTRNPVAVNRVEVIRVRIDYSCDHLPGAQNIAKGLLRGYHNDTKNQSKDESDCSIAEIVMRCQLSSCGVSNTVKSVEGPVSFVTAEDKQRVVK